MKLKLEATDDEIATKGARLVKSLAHKLGVDLDTMEKSEPVQHHHQPMRDLSERTRHWYKAEMDAMIREIEAVLTQAE